MHHQHYDETQDKRWTCRRDPCTWHDVAPEPVTELPEPAPGAGECEQHNEVFSRICLQCVGTGLQRAYDTGHAAGVKEERARSLARELEWQRLFAALRVAPPTPNP